MESYLLPIMVCIPIMAMLLVFFSTNKNEKYISSIAIFSSVIHAILTFTLIFLWLLNNRKFILFHGIDLYNTGDTHFSIDFYFDRVSAFFLAVSSFLVLIVNIFSKYYMHRERGYKRFYDNILFFFAGINIIIFSGNFETLFIGWEIIGVTSFFLISFYRDRYLPVKNALKVVSLYRLADILLLLVVWLSHHYFGRSIHFSEFLQPSFLSNTVSEHHNLIYIITFMCLLVAAIKSAQFPFSSWLPRAMEGPSTSSAIFYGALSVHIGIFLMLRCYPLYENSIGFQSIIIVFSVFTAIISTLIARVQSSVKTQIAYSSIAQISVIFIEISLGWHTLAFIHFVCNASLRCYQLLVSPSVLSYLIHDQFFHFIPPQHNFGDSMMGRMRKSFFILSIKEWNIDKFHYYFLWKPLKDAGNIIAYVPLKVMMAVGMLGFALGLYFVYHPSLLPVSLYSIMPELAAAMALILILRAFVYRGHVVNAWMLIVFSQLFTSISIGMNEQFDFFQVHIFLSGIFMSSILGLFIIYRMHKAKEHLYLSKFHGHAYEYPRVAFLFVIACLGLAGFPITPAFIGEDLLLGHIKESQILLTVLIAVTLLLDGLVVFRLYARIFLGPHEKGYHETAFRSS